MENQTQNDTQKSEPKAEIVSEFEQHSQWDNLPAPPSDPELNRLRELVFAREIALVNRLKRTLDGGEYSSREMVKIVGNAIAARSANDERFNAAMSPTVEKIVQRSMRTNRADFVNLLFPLMGPSIRRSIAENLRTMLNSFSQSIENAISWRGIRWRLEALRSGKSFSDIVLMHTIVYRVEQVFLIHCETGLVLSHLTSPEVQSQDADMIGAMLTAINDFVRDCFAGDESNNLEALRMGEFTIIVERRESIYIACVVRGTPPVQLYGKVSDALDQVNVECASQIASFSGDTAPFQHAVRFLEPLLDTKYAEERKPFPTWGKVVAVMLVIGLIIFAGHAFYKHRLFVTDIENAVETLQLTPGILVLERHEIDDEKIRFVILRDEYADNARDVINDNPSQARIEFFETPYVSLEDKIVERRVLAQTRPPETAKLFYDNGVATLYGEAPSEWIESARRVLESSPGVKWVNTEEISDPALTHVLQLARLIEAITIEFPFGRSEPVGSNMVQLERAADMLVELEYAASRIGFIPSLTIYGHADSAGSVRQNYTISQDRVRTLAAMLYARGSSIPISMYGMGAKYPKLNDLGEPNLPSDVANRRIEMRVRLLRSAQVSAM